jgi:hypothetical protein
MKTILTILVLSICALGQTRWERLAREYQRKPNSIRAYTRLERETARVFKQRQAIASKLAYDYYPRRQYRTCDGDYDLRTQLGKW